jgi:acid stress-induced BolA-like protein IbaG/YrbA
MSPAEVQALIQAHLPDCSAQVHSDDNVHFEAVVISRHFAGKPRLQRHQMVYGALGGRMGAEIHALSIQALTPEELAQRGA